MKIISFVLISITYSGDNVLGHEVTFDVYTKRITPETSLFTKEIKDSKENLKINTKEGELLDGNSINANLISGHPIPINLFLNLCKHCKEVNLSIYDEDNNLKHEIEDMEAPRARRTLNHDKSSERKLTLFADPLSNVDADLDGDTMINEKADGTILLEIVAKKPVLVTMDLTPKAVDENIGRSSLFDDPLSNLEIDEKRLRNGTNSLGSAALGLEG